MSDNQDKPVRHLLGLSGGKDSAALAIYMRDKVPEMEYFFADTGAELPETLAFVDLMEDYLFLSYLFGSEHKRKFPAGISICQNFMK